jgi:hypothetical protein
VVNGNSYSYTGYEDIIGGEDAIQVQPSTTPNTVYVSWDGGWDYMTIQEGIDNAPCEDDWVVVLDGTYTGNQNKNLDFGGRNLVLMGGGPGGTIIDCEYVGRGFYFHSGEDTTSIVSGLTIRRGSPSGTFPYGGGINIDNASPKFDYVIVEDCHAYCGGGVSWVDGGPVLKNMLIWNNTATDYGGGVFCTRDSSGRVEDTEISGNIADYSGGGMYNTYCENGFRDVTLQANVASFGGGAYIGRSAPTLERTLVEGNVAGRGAGLFLQYESEPFITRTTVVNNDSDVGQSAVECNNSFPVIRQTIVSHTVEGAGVTCVSGGVPDIMHSCIWANAGGDSLCGNYRNNIFFDPFYCDAAGNDFTLHSDSPCLPPYNPYGVHIGRYGPGGCGYVGVDDGLAPVTSLRLDRPSPSPFSGMTTIGYEAPPRSADLNVAVYDASGRVVRTLHDGPAAQSGRLTWDGCDEAGRRVAAGVYFVRAAFGEEEVARKLVVLR